MEQIKLREEDYICANCKYYGCDRSKNCETSGCGNKKGREKIYDLRVCVGRYGRCL